MYIFIYHLGLYPSTVEPHYKGHLGAKSSWLLYLGGLLLSSIQCTMCIGKYFGTLPADHYKQADRLTE